MLSALQNSYIAFVYFALILLLITTSIGVSQYTLQTSKLCKTNWLTHATEVHQVKSEIKSLKNFQAASVLMQIAFAVIVIILALILLSKKDSDGVKSVIIAIVVCILAILSPIIGVLQQKYEPKNPCSSSGDQIAMLCSQIILLVFSITFIVFFSIGVSLRARAK